MTVSRPVTASAYETAVQAVIAGRYVLPCCGIDKSGLSTCGQITCDRPGKHPLVKGGGKAATSNEKVVAKWHERFPEANWAWVPGRSRLAVVDKDDRNGGEASLDQLQSQYGRFPDTEIVKTGDGNHYTFVVPENTHLAPALIADGLEIKSGPIAYLILPGSLHHSGRVYEYVTGHGLGQVDIAPMPDWLVQTTRRVLQSNRAQSSSQELDLSSREVDIARLEKHIEPGTHLWKLWTHDLSISGDLSPSGFDYKILLELARLGYDFEEAHPVAVKHRQDNGYEVSKLFRRDYVERTWLAVESAKSITREVAPASTYERNVAIQRALWLSDEILNKNGTLTHVFALQILASYVKDGVCYMSGGRLAKHLHQSERNGHRVLGWLKLKKYITAMSRPERGSATVWDLSFLNN